MTMRENLYYDKLTVNHSMPEWVRSERYEYCEDFYESYTTDESHSILAKMASILTSLFI